MKQIQQLTCIIEREGDGYVSLSQGVTERLQSLLYGFIPLLLVSEEWGSNPDSLVR